MKIETFEDMPVWRSAQTMACEIYRHFEKCKDFSFRDQIRRAAVSVPTNVAEGYERRTNKEFIQFLFIAKGSCAEVRSLSDLAFSLSMVDKHTLVKWQEQSLSISKQISGLIKYLRSKILSVPKFYES